MKVAIYARISTSTPEKDKENEREKGRRVQDLEVQLTPLRDYCFRQGWEVYKEYADEYTGKKREGREALKQLMEDARLKYFDAVLVIKLDRFARSVKDLSDLLHELDRYNVRFIALSQGIDTDVKNPMSKLLLNILAAFAEFEAAIIVERVYAGLARAKAKGIKLGRKKRIFNREKLMDDRKAGMSLAQLAKKHGIPRPSVARYVRELTTP